MKKHPYEASIPYEKYNLGSVKNLIKSEVAKRNINMKVRLRVYYLIKLTLNAYRITKTII